MSEPRPWRVLVTGGGSYLGQHLVPLAASHFQTSYTYFQHDPLQRPSGYQLDVRDDTAVSAMVQRVQPQVIIHTVGSNRGADMENVIRLGTAHITQAAIAAQARLVHLSTDSIFRGDMPPYAETAVPDPINAYGRAKADAEAIVHRHPQAVIVRTSLIYGLERMDHGTAWMVRALEAGQPVLLFNNQIRNPIWVQTLSQACLELVTHPYRGILNVAGRQPLTRADFALKMLDYWDVTERDTLLIGPATDGRWPLDCTYDLSRATAVLQTTLLGVDEVLAQAAKQADFSARP